MGKGAKKSEAQSYSENTFVYMQQVCGVKVARLTSGDLSICLGYKGMRRREASFMVGRSQQRPY